MGVHTGLQRTTTADLRDLWTRIEAAGFDYISIWDHFYSADFTEPDCHEAVACHAALACTTNRVRCGSLVYCAAYRHPVVLAKAIATIDHLSNGRAELGIGAGWAFNEFAAAGLPYGSNKERLDMMEEAVQCLKLLLHDDVANFSGTYYTLDNFQLEPRPVQAKVPVVVGGRGEKRTLKIVATHADYWNTAYVSPADFAHLKDALAAHCERIGRDPADIHCSINLAHATSDEHLRHQFGPVAEAIRGGVVMGSDEEIVDRYGEYAEAGADQINLALRTPWSAEWLEGIAPKLLALRS
jgi:alkanesulfonate monooxygenase SsuD/methylene tetrahydromethanopterin reductase-like flavin-dependent oxidoreductase (luciferase family)